MFELKEENRASYEIVDYTNEVILIRFHLVGFKLPNINQIDYLLNGDVKIIILYNKLINGYMYYTLSADDCVANSEIVAMISDNNKKKVPEEIFDFAVNKYQQHASVEIKKSQESSDLEDFYPDFDKVIDDKEFANRFTDYIKDATVEKYVSLSKIAELCENRQLNFDYDCNIIVKLLSLTSKIDNSYIRNKFLEIIKDISSLSNQNIKQHLIDILNK